MERYHFADEQRALMEGMQMPFAIYQFIDKRVVTLVLSDGFCKLFGYDDRALAYHDMDNDMYKDAHPDDVARIADAAFRFAVEGGTYEVVYRTKDYRTENPSSSGYRIVHALGEHVYMDGGTRLAHVWYTDEGAYAEDESSQRAELNRVFGNSLRENSLLQENRYDYLTGLPTMTYFFELAVAGRDAILKDGGSPAMLFMDLSGMKYFNDRYGFSEGNVLLQEFSKTLARYFSNENCCHIGGDHFAVYTREEGLEDTLERFFEDCRNINDGNSLPVRVGIYPKRTESVPASVAFDRAKFACDTLRDSFESGFNYYDKRLRHDADRRRYILSSLDRAIEEKWIKVYFQPIVRAVNGRVCDEEALSRWIDPARGVLSPAEFIPVLEDANLIYKLDLYVVEQVLEKMKRQAKERLEVVPHSINLSRSDFDACDIVEEIRARVDDAGIDRNKISIEITESIIGSDFEFMKQQIERFQDLGFPVWMDDFGSGYSSLDVLQSIKFNLVKFDMSFMQRLEEGEGVKIVLTELMKMMTALGVDTICEGVETESQARFLQEIGCSKLQGFYYVKPSPFEAIVERYESGIQIGYENPQESAYYDLIGRVNLYDLSVIASGDESTFQNFFDTLPMSILEYKDNEIQYARSNPSYRAFVERFFGVDLSSAASTLTFSAHSTEIPFMNLIRRCCDGSENRTLFDEQMPDGSSVHSFVRKIGENPVTGKAAVVVVILSITDPNEGTTYASIARALAADYYNLYYVDLETESFIEYTSPVGGEDLAMERHGEDFFEAARRDAERRIHPDDWDAFSAEFTKENVVRELDEQGAFTISYQLVDGGEPMRVNMKVTRMQSDGNHIIIGISIADSQVRQKEDSVHT